MKRSPEKVSGRCARISIYISLSLLRLPPLSFRDRFEKVRRSTGIKSVESRDVTRIMRIVPQDSERWFVPVSLLELVARFLERKGWGNRDICSREIVLSPELPGW